MEPIPSAGRLTPVRWTVALVVVLGLFAPAVVSGEAAAQTATYSIEAEAGVGGFVRSDAPTVLSVRLGSEVLLVGDLLLDMGRSTYAVPVEVPAGGVKQYFVELPPPGTDRRLTLRLAPEEGEPPPAQVINLRIPSRDELLVGVAGAPEVVQTLGLVRSAPLGRAVTAIPLTHAALDHDLSVLGYLVLGDEAATEVRTPAAMEDYVAEGGRLVTTAAAAGQLGLPAGQAAPLTVGAAVARHGAGEVIVADLATLDATGWSRVLRDLPAPPPASGAVQNADFSLVHAASVGSFSVPGIPWLLAALAFYVLLVGPINFLVLRRIGKVDWAWLTIPVISLVAVTGFWVVGRRQVAGFEVTQATVVMQTNGKAKAVSAITVIADRGSSVALPGDWVGFPIDLRGFGVGGDGKPTITRTAAGTVLDFAGGERNSSLVGARWEAPSVDISVALSDGNLATVENRSDLDFSAWGVSSGRSSGAASALPAGGTAELRLQNVRDIEPFAPPLFDVIARGPGQEFEFDVLYPLMEAAGWVMPAGMRSQPFFFGVTEGIEPTIEVDGNRVSVAGNTLVVVSLDGIPSASVQPVLLDSGAAQEDAEFPGGGSILFGADTVVVRYLLPPGVPAKLRGTSLATFGDKPTGAEVYDWEAGAWVDVGWPAVIEGSRFRSPADEVVVRFDFPGFSEVFPVEHQLMWDTT